MIDDPIDWTAALFWVALVAGLVIFWGTIAYFVRAAIAGNPKPDPPHIVCNESAPKPHIGTAIVCFSQP